MATFTTPDHIDLTELVGDAKADAFWSFVFTLGPFGVILLAGLVLIAALNVWKGRASRDDVGFLEFVGDIAASVIR